MVATREATARSHHPPEPDAIRAPLFGRAVERMEGGGRWVVLDLGAARSSTIALFSQYRCRLDIADLVRRPGRLNVDPVRSDLGRRLEALFPPVDGEQTDVVLCWDLLNYLSRPAIAALMSAIATRASPRVLVHSLIYYSSPRMPDRPSAWTPDGPDRLVVGGQSASDMDAPRYAPKTLLKFMPGWGVERAMLLGNGMQEYLLRPESVPVES